MGSAVGEILVGLVAPTVGATSGLTFATSTEGSKASSQAKSATTPSECVQSDDCHEAYICQAGRCVTTPVGDLASPAQVTKPAEPLPTHTVPKDGRCGQDTDCAQGLVCRSSYCAVPEQVQLRRQAVQVYLAARVVELREELVFGRGPIISTLAGVTAVPAPRLGQTLRAHRRELVSLIGDGSDAGWSNRFLQRVDALISG